MEEKSICLSMGGRTNVQEGRVISGEVSPGGFTDKEASMAEMGRNHSKFTGGRDPPTAVF